MEAKANFVSWHMNGNKINKTKQIKCFHRLLIINSFMRHTLQGACVLIVLISHHIRQFVSYSFSKPTATVESMTHHNLLIAVVILGGIIKIIAFTEEVYFDDECNDYDANDDEEEFTDLATIIPNLLTACTINARASDEDVQFVLANVVPETRVQKCFVACWMERLQIVLATAANSKTNGNSVIVRC